MIVLQNRNKTGEMEICLSSCERNIFTLQQNQYIENLFSWNYIQNISIESVENSDSTVQNCFVYPLQILTKQYLRISISSDPSPSGMFFFHSIFACLHLQLDEYERQNGSLYTSDYTLLVRLEFETRLDERELPIRKYQISLCNYQKINQKDKN